MIPFTWNFRKGNEQIHNCQDGGRERFHRVVRRRLIELVFVILNAVLVLRFCQRQEIRFSKVNMSMGFNFWLLNPLQPLSRGASPTPCQSSKTHPGSAHSRRGQGLDPLNQVYLSSTCHPAPSCFRMGTSDFLPWIPLPSCKAGTGADTQVHAVITLSHAEVTWCPSTMLGSNVPQPASAP